MAESATTPEGSIGLEEREPTVEITTATRPEDALLAGFADVGLGGLTAADYLADHLDLEETGHVTVEGVPAITPFENGTPRHHTRLFSRPDLDLTVLVGELFVPPPAAGGFTDAIAGWLRENGVSEVAVLSGLPIPHGPEAHQVFSVATRDFQDTRLADTDVEPMGNGFLDGINAGLVQQGLDSPPAVGILTTPVHTPAPDVEAAIRLIETAEELYGIDVDTDPLEAFATEVREYYESLGQQIDAAAESSRPAHDQMYM